MHDKRKILRGPVVCFFLDKSTVSAIIIQTMEPLCIKRGSAIVKKKCHKCLHSTEIQVIILRNEL